MAKNSIRILAIDDEPHVMRFLQSNLQLANYTVQAASRGIEGLRLALEASPDLVLLDLGLPDTNGLEVLRQLRRESDVPVIIITARDDEESMVAGLSQGADDYLIKPFSGRALQARIEAVLRRYRVTAPAPLEQAYYQIGPLYVDVSDRRVTLDGKPVSLTPLEFALLGELIRSAGRVRLHSDLLTTVWGPEYRDDVTVLRAAIYRLRHKIELDPSNPKFVRTEAGVGYSFCVTDSALAGPPLSLTEAYRAPRQAQLVPQLNVFGDSRA
jgi:two-component system KDP operon response regulator KdpE